MDIVYRLPIPDILCDKVLLYALYNKYSYELQLVKELSSTLNSRDLYHKLKKQNNIVLDRNGNLLKVMLVDIPVNMRHNIIINIKDMARFTMLQKVSLSGIILSGDIKHLKSLKYLQYLDLSVSTIVGDIEILNDLPELDLSLIHI